MPDEPATKGVANVTLNVYCAENPFVENIVEKELITVVAAVVWVVVVMVVERV